MCRFNRRVFLSKEYIITIEYGVKSLSMGSGDASVEQIWIYLDPQNAQKCN
jgi:hypothetical protein